MVLRSDLETGRGEACLPRWASLTTKQPWLQTALTWVSNKFQINSDGQTSEPLQVQVTSVINTAPAFFLYLLSDWRTFLLSMCPYILLSSLFMFLLSPFMLHCSNYTHSNPINPKHLWTFTLMTSHWHSLMRVTCSHSSCFHTSADQRDPPPPPCTACFALGERKQEVMLNNTDLLLRLQVSVKFFCMRQINT